MPSRTRMRDEDPPIRYAVVGMGYISQVAIMPAFAHATSNSALAAIVSDDPTKRKSLGRKYGVSNVRGYEDYDGLLRSGDIDAVFIALPNSMHHDFTLRAADAGVHVLCEKPMAVTERQCREMIAACEGNGVRLMIAYRLHFEAANLAAVEMVRSGKLGDVRIFHSAFTMQVKDRENIRLRADLGGGPLFDIGIYCINACRMIFGEEPEEVFAHQINSGDERFSEVEETVSCTLRYPGERVANFVTSFGAADAGWYQAIGTKGDICLDPAYEYAEGLTLHATIDGKESRRRFTKRDQFAPELIYFSDCIRTGREPEPSGREGLADVRIIRALGRSAHTGEPERLEPFESDEGPTKRQRIDRPGVRKPQLVGAKSPSGE